MGTYTVIVRITTRYIINANSHEEAKLLAKHHYHSDKFGKVEIFATFQEPE